jgi:3-oxoacyl-[acyl-carrier-protein] synthase-3
MEELVMFIIGVGAATPTTELSEQFLASIGLTLDGEERALLSRAGVTARRVSLPLEYIREKGNRDVLEGRAVATVSPTALAVQAANQALSRAGITIEQVGLLLADTATPYQTCPSEAQRIAGALGVKIPAYDIIAGSAALPFYLELLSSWKPERIPEYVLCLSTNTTSQHVLYAEGALAAHLYGDAAAAFVLSTRVKGRFSVVDSHIRRHGFLKQSTTIGQHLSVSTEAMLAADDVKGLVKEALQRVPKGVTPQSVVAPALYTADVESAVQELCGSSVVVDSGIKESGYALGASSGVALSSMWDSVKQGQHVVVLHAGDGVWGGGILLGSE